MNQILNIINKSKIKNSNINIESTNIYTNNLSIKNSINSKNNETLSSDSNKQNSKNNKISFLKLQFFISIIIIIIIFFIYFYNQFSINEKEKISNRLINNYNISTLYADLNENKKINNYKIKNDSFYVIGIIEIPKLNISYPILSNINDNLLKIAPCKISGPMPNEIGNLCIAGHNYDNYKFFSKITTLNINDEIIIYDLYNNKKSYFVFDKFEVRDNDLSPLNSSTINQIELTLITCNNGNSKRIIVKAKVEQ